MKSILIGAALLALCCFSIAANSAPVVSSGYSLSIFASGLGAADGMALDSSSGDLLVTDYDGGRVLRFESPYPGENNSFSVYATGIPNATDVISIPDGRVFATSGSTGQLIEVASNGSTSVFASGLTNPTAITSIGSTLYVANSGAGTISAVDLSGNVTTYLSGYAAGNGPFGIASDSSGNIYFTEHVSGDIYRASNSTTVDLLGSLSSSLGAGQLVYAPNGDLIISDSATGTLHRLDVNGALSVFATGFAAKVNAPFIGPTGIVFESAGSLLVGDGNTIWRISAIPIPASAWLFGTGLIGLIGIRNLNKEV